MNFVNCVSLTSTPISFIPQLSISVNPRSWHVAVACYMYPSSKCTHGEVMVTGGTKYIRGNSGLRKHVSDTFTLQFGRWPFCCMEYYIYTLLVMNLVLLELYSVGECNHSSKDTCNEQKLNRS